jgi:hypothetical protein
MWSALDPAARRSFRSFLLLGASALLALDPGGSPARAVPSFARQTGMPCTACHTAFPQLTPFGRAFKIGGYTLSDGQSKLPPLALMLQGAPGFTHTGADQQADDLPSGFNDNDNVSLNQISGFYAGRLLGPYADKVLPAELASWANKLGVFVQGTYDGVAREAAWDNTEIRFADARKAWGRNVVYGLYANNNPTLQDPWNTTPAWGFPFSGSNLAPGPAAAPLIAGGLAQQVAGVGGYTLLADTLYLEVGGYDTLSASLQRNLGVDPEGEAQIDSFAPYWRLAVQHGWGPSTLSVGTYGLQAHTFPGREQSAGTDRLTDLAADLEFQYLGARNEVTLLLNGIFEREDWRASRVLGLTANPGDDLWSTTATVSYLFDQTYGFDVQYFRTAGDTDPLLYESRTGSPDTSGYVLQLDYLPFNKHGGPEFWPMSNVKLSVQYTHYSKFDGSRRNFDGAGRDAADNDTLYFEIWLAL